MLVLGRAGSGCGGYGVWWWLVGGGRLGGWDGVEELGGLVVGWCMWDVGGRVEWWWLGF